ncbi:uncharacterized protein LOC106013439, partial [Aplysia californica]|uniref:Uncharacterized protein LOC106013439 n=1 Tax=Aplysia californica TaxID=6500 RepID=A0ABM1ABR2_APLCA
MGSLPMVVLDQSQMLLSSVMMAAVTLSLVPATTGQRQWSSRSSRLSSYLSNFNSDLSSLGASSSRSRLQKLLLADLALSEPTPGPRGRGLRGSGNLLSELLGGSGSYNGNQGGSSYRRGLDNLSGRRSQLSDVILDVLRSRDRFPGRQMSQRSGGLQLGPNYDVYPSRNQNVGRQGLRDYGGLNEPGLSSRLNNGYINQQGPSTYLSGSGQSNNLIGLANSIPGSQLGYNSQLQIQQQQQVQQQQQPQPIQNSIITYTQTQPQQPQPQQMQQATRTIIQQPQTVTSNAITSTGVATGQSNLVPLVTSAGPRLVLQGVSMVQPTQVLLQQTPQVVPVISVAAPPVVQQPPQNQVGYSGVGGMGSGLRSGNMPARGRGMFPGIGPVIVKIEDLFPSFQNHKNSEGGGSGGRGGLANMETPHPTDPNLSVVKLDEGLTVVLNHSNPYKKIVNLPTPTNEEEAKALKNILEKMEAPEYLRDMIRFEPRLPPSGFPGAGIPNMGMAGTGMMGGAMVPNPVMLPQTPQAAPNMAAAAAVAAAAAATV